MTYADAAPNTFALVRPVLDSIAQVLDRQDDQIAMIAATHVAYTLILNRCGRSQQGPQIQRLLDTLDTALGVLYDVYEHSLAEQIRQ